MSESPTRILIRYWIANPFSVGILVASLTMAIAMSSITLSDAVDGWRGTGVSWYTLENFLFVGSAFIIIVTAARGIPLISEDARTNANLFYFNRPIRWFHYFKAKLVVAYSPVLIILPILLISLAATLVVTIPNAEIGEGMQDFYAGRSGNQLEVAVAEFEAETIDTVAEGFQAFGLAIAALAIVGFMAPPLVFLASSLSTRIYFGALMLGGFVVLNVILSISFYSSNNFNVYRNLRSPIDIAFFILGGPTQLFGINPRAGRLYDLADFWAVYILGALLLVALGVGALVASAYRIQRLEASP